MLFNSYSFLFVFLPLSFIFFALLYNNFKRQFTLLYLFIASVVFYGYWNLQYLPLLLGSILFNYCISQLIDTKSKYFYYPGLAGNILLLIYFKYSHFIIENINMLFDQPFKLMEGDLPLGISFFTFTQIAYLTDKYTRKISTGSFINYGLFITFFPHLMAGPILHHKEIMPQFADNKNQLLSWKNCAIGLAIFSIGLFKKTMIADSLAPYVNIIFNSASKGSISFIDAWCGGIAYSFQLYFDFSGYSDMAIGLARIFGIIFPLNFNSPYKSLDIISFWRRWHMTLSRFLRDYIYIPLGGNRNGDFNRYRNLMITMLVGGLWHGAAWTFVIWGGLHGAYLIINHLWNSLCSHVLQNKLNKQHFLYKTAAQSLTFLAVMLGWIYFRSDSFFASNNIVQTLFNGTISLNTQLFSRLELLALLKLIAITGIIVFFAPNTQQLLHNYKPALEIYPGEIEPYPLNYITWSPSVFTAAICALLTLFSLLTFGHVSEFLYYKF